MEGRKFSSSRRVVIYVRDFLERYDADALRYYIIAAGPETQDTDFTWSEFVRRNNDELVAAWGNLVNRSVSMAAKNLGEIPRPASSPRRTAASWTAPGPRSPRSASTWTAPGSRPRSRRPCARSPRPTSTSPTRPRGR